MDMQWRKQRQGIVGKVGMMMFEGRLSPQEAVIKNRKEGWEVAGEVCRLDEGEIVAALIMSAIVQGVHILEDVVFEEDDE